jgi:23S rRNA pseudouridine1911/1915/1917 synthase
MKTQIIYEDNEILVVYKPEGLAAQSARVTQPDVVSEMCTYLKSPYVGLVHRLDQPVEGLMVLGKTKAAAAALSAQLTKGELKKTYLAVVSAQKYEDSLLGEWTQLTDYLEKDAKTGKAQIVESGGQKAVLFYRKKDEKEDNTALIEIDLLTGRFHQIRAQMAHANMPLLGDVQYGVSDPEVKSVALCAYKLKFLHPKTKKPMEFEIKPKKAIFNRYEM